LQADGGARAAAKAGQSVRFLGTVEVPPNAGKVVAIAWDFEGDGESEHHTPQFLREPQTKMNVAAQHVYAKPGTYFAVLRVFSQRDGDTGTRYALVENLARARVVVS
jgi:hypothetical protein